MPAPVVLVVTCLEDVTADLVITALHRWGVEVARVDPADIGPALRFDATIGTSPGWAGRVRTATREVELAAVRSVYHRRPTPWTDRFGHLPHQQRDFAVTEARHGLGGLLANLPGARYVNHPAATARADVKPAQLQTAARLGLPIPPTVITNDVETARAFAAEHDPVVYKTFRGVPPGPDGYAGAIWTQRIAPQELDESLNVTAHLFQAEVPKVADARVTMVGHRVFAQTITTPDRALDWRRGDWDALTYTATTVPDRVATGLRAYLDAFDLVFGCFDFALTGSADDPDGWVFIECNPNGQWAFLPDADNIAEAFAAALQEGRHGV